MQLLLLLATKAKSKIAAMNAAAVAATGKPAVKTVWGYPVNLDPDFRIIVETKSFQGENFLSLIYLPGNKELGRF